MKLVMEMFKKYRVTEDGRLYKPVLFTHFGDSKLMHYTLGLKLEPYKNVKIIQFCSWHGKLDDTFTSVCHLSSLDLEKLNK
jgi:hypothetical protein